MRAMAACFRDREALMARLQELRAGLEQQGVSEPGMLEFFGKLAGRCAKIEACSCKAHELGEVPLPKGKMCSIRFNERLDDIVKKMELVRGRVERCEAYIAQVRLEEEGMGFLDEGQEVVRGLKKRRLESEQFLSHEKGLYLKLAGERLELLVKWEPLDVKEYSQSVSSSIVELGTILHELKAPGVAKPGPVPLL